MFVGREKEMGLLKGLLKRKTASLVVCRGRRRIGKSRLIEEFGKEFQRFFVFQGLPPRSGITAKSQLDHFGRQCSQYFDFPPLKLANWTQAFSLLAKQSSSGKILILLDEISWMSIGSADFAGELKVAWDTLFKKNEKLIIVLCGSIASWIDKNILNNTGFVGRVSLTLSLSELSLNHCNAFWGKQKKRISALEKFKILSVTGGVPRYLEEIRPELTADVLIKQLCFTKEGLLFNEFEHIFNDVFSRRAKLYKDIVKTLVPGHLGFLEICQKLKKQKSGVISEYLADLVESGFLSLDQVYKTGGQEARFARYRLKDNYLRFYLRYIEKNRSKIKAGLFDFKSLELFPGWEIIMGLQFENVVVNNFHFLIRVLNIPVDTIISAAPYFQTQTTRQKACQIDFLLETNYSIYLCEIKFRKKISPNVISEMQEKLSRLKLPKQKSIRTVLIYEGDLAKEIEHEGFFNQIISFKDCLE